MLGRDLSKDWQGWGLDLSINWQELSSNCLNVSSDLSGCSLGRSMSLEEEEMEREE